MIFLIFHHIILSFLISIFCILPTSTLCKTQSAVSGSTTIIFGILWELFEYHYGKHRPGWLGGDCRNDSNWWYAKYSDIVINALM